MFIVRFQLEDAVVWPDDTRSAAQMLCDKEEIVGHISSNARRFQFTFSPQRHTRLVQPASRFFEDIRHFSGILTRCASNCDCWFHISAVSGLSLRAFIRTGTKRRLRLSQNQIANMVQEQNDFRPIFAADRFGPYGVGKR